jgi:hypothetical protein
MSSAIEARLIAAVVAVLVAELTDKVLDFMGVSEDTAKLPREVVKAVAAALAALLAEGFVKDSNFTVDDLVRDD